MKNLQAMQYQLLAGPQASATTARTATMDLSTYGADYVAIMVPVNAEANTNSTNVILTVAHADVDAATNYATLGTVLIDNTAAAVGVAVINTLDKKKYLKVTVTPDTTTNGAVVVGGIQAVITPEIMGLTNHTTGYTVVVT